jgi:hypothetical protein
VVDRPAKIGNGIFSQRVKLRRQPMLKCVNVQELTDGILLRLFLVSSHFAQDQRPDEATDWRHIAGATRWEIDRRGLSREQVEFFASCDAANLARILVAFEQEQARERRRRVQ